MGTLLGRATLSGPIWELTSTLHSQLQNIIILKFNSPLLLNLLGNILPYCQLSEQYRESTLPMLISRKDNAGVVIENVGILTRVGIYEEI